MTDGAADLDDLHWHWGEAYLIHHLGPDTWVAQRRDSRQTLGAEDPETLRERIKADYAARPVSRRVAGAGRPQEPGRWRSLLIAGVSRERQGSEPVLHRVRPEYDEYGLGASARHSREDAVREHGRPDQDSGVSGGIGVSRPVRRGHR